LYTVVALVVVHRRNAMEEDFIAMEEDFIANDQ
jgi:hypothetical protein